MKTNNLMKNLFLIGILGTALSVSSCKKGDLTEEIQQQQSTETGFTSTADNAGAEDLSADLLETAQDAVDNSGNSGKSSGICATISVDSLAADLRQVIIDFGEEGCVGLDGRTRQGRIIVLVKGKPWVAGSGLEIRPEDYYVDGFHLEGIKYVYYKGLNSAGNYVFIVKLAGGKITSPDGVSITLDFEKNHELVAGDPNSPDDDVMLISGEGYGTNRDGIKYEIKSLKELKRVRSCRFIVEGILEVTPEGKPSFTIDFGDGTCDDLATVTFNGQSKVVKIRRPWKL